MTWTVPSPSPVDGPMTGDDRPILEGYLNYQRATLLNICAGLTGEQLAGRPLPSSNLSLLGLIRHLAKVERIWFRQRAAGQAVAPLYDPALGKDADFSEADAADAEAAWPGCGRNGARLTRSRPAWTSRTRWTPAVATRSRSG